MTEVVDEIDVDEIKRVLQKILDAIEEDVAEPIREVIRKLEQTNDKKIVVEELNNLINKIGEVSIES